MEMSGQVHAPAALPPGKSPKYPLYTRLGGTKSRSVGHAEDKTLLALSGIELRPLGRSAHSLVVTVNELSSMTKYKREIYRLCENMPVERSAFL
jgi:hypothetical protein